MLRSQNGKNAALLMTTAEYSGFANHQHNGCVFQPGNSGAVHITLGKKCVYVSVFWGLVLAAEANTNLSCHDFQIKVAVGEELLRI